MISRTESSAEQEPLGSSKTTSDGLRYFGSSGRHGTLVLIHGFMDGPASWWPMIHDLHLADWGVLVPDLTSISIDETSGENALEQFARAIRGLIEEEVLRNEAPFVVAGQSMGGQIAELVAAQCGPGLAGLILLCPAPLKGYPLNADLQAVFQRRALDRDASSVAEGRKRLAPNASESAMKTLVATCLRTPEGSALAQLNAWSTGHPDGEAPSKVSAPLLLVSSDDTFFTHDYLQENTGARFEDVKSVQISGAGHWPHVEKPKDVAWCIASFVSNLASHD